MECMEARALKSSFFSELAMKSTQHACLDDLLCLNTINAVSCDDFSVDVFLDLPDNDFKDVEFEDDEEEKDLFSVSSQDRVDDDSTNYSTFSGTSYSGSSLTEEFAVPVDDLENLEWLSQFVDDSVSELSLLCPPGSLKEKTGEFAGNRSEKETEPAVPRPSACFPAPVPSKTRSKRSRPNSRVWSLGSPCISESSSSSSSSSTPCLIFPSPVDNTELFYSVAKPAPKKQKRKASSESSGESQTQRRCSHCHVQKTPQWRTGPLGPKTLCNACGVRYKSGRLYPEYRPACSPTFSGDLHSNSHRKVLEMRRNKEISEMESGLTSLVPSF